MHYIEKLTELIIHKIYEIIIITVNKVKKSHASLLRYVGSFLSNMLFVFFVSAGAETSEAKKGGGHL